MTAKIVAILGLFLLTLVVYFWTFIYGWGLEPKSYIVIFLSIIFTGILNNLAQAVMKE